MAEASLIGMGAIARLAFEGRDAGPLADMLMARANAPGGDPAALIDLATVLYSHGRRDEAGDLMQAALAVQRDYRVVHGAGTGPRLLAFVTAGDFMANTPLDFMLEGSDAVLLLRYVDAGTEALDDLPAHDMAFLAIGEAPETRGVLARMARLLASYHGPVLNRDAARIAALTRDGVGDSLSDAPGILAPPSHPVPRGAAAAAAAELGFPLLVRPVGSHAGQGLHRVAGLAELDAALAGAGDEVYLTPFIDYRGPDGRYAKMRIVFLNGRAFPCHMAVSDHWMVHYLNAGMAEDAEKRALEAGWMAGFEGFAARHATAFATLRQRIGLDYFGIDCAEAPDGRLLVFEADVAMIVHGMDDPQLFPYKAPAMQALFRAMLAAAGGVARPN